MLEVTPTEDDMLKVCLTEDNITSCCYTSSMHLVEDHRKQLERANNRKAAACYAEFLAPLHDA
jgi:hypothetical protein